MEQNRNVQYYLNQGIPCKQLPLDNLKKSNYLSEFESEEDKEKARDNLGIPDVIQEVIEEAITEPIEQKTTKLFEAIRRIWRKLKLLTGETSEGIVLTLSQNTYFGEDGCDVHVQVNSGTIAGMFEVLQLYLNDEMVLEEFDVNEFDQTIHISDTTTLTCRIKMFGLWYEESDTITKYNYFWLGAGNTYQDVMIPSKQIPINKIFKGNYNVPFNNGDRLIIVVNNQITDSFKRADMNGLEIPFTESVVTVNGTQYRVFTSTNTYNSGIFNIDINS